MDPDTNPVLVIGAGPAGASVAIFLAQLGISAVLVDCKAQRSLKIGESLPPDARLLLEQLNVYDTFQRGPHLKCPGNQSVWGEDRIHYADFMGHALLHGWRLDREAFETMLLDKARSLGQRFLVPVSLLSAEFRQGRWEVALSDGSRQAYSFVVDATGRNSWFARRQGAERLYEDRQLAMVAFLQSVRGAFELRASLVETTRHGWWYAGKIPGDRVATAFMCAPTAEQRTSWVQEARWWELFGMAPKLMGSIRHEDHEFIAPPRWISAESGMLDPLCGEGWLAVGDAALRYDPIASHGIMMAMVTARDAAGAIGTYLRTEGGPAIQGDALKKYAQTLTSAFAAYSEQRRGFYLAERRFLNSGYWRGRVN